MGANQKRFCEQCGSEVSANAKFCGKCGQPMGAAAPTPGLAPAGRVEAAPPEQVKMSVAQDQACAVAQAAPKKKKSGCLGRILAILAGLALIFLGLRGPILGIAGQSDTAVITGVSGPDDEDNYTITYQFVVDGKTVSGSYSQETLNITTLPTEGQTISVRYLPQWTAMNAPTRQTSPSIGMLLLTGLGVLLILFSGKVRIG